MRPATTSSSPAAEHGVERPVDDRSARRARPAACGPSPPEAANRAPAAGGQHHRRRRSCGRRYRRRSARLGRRCGRTGCRCVPSPQSGARSSSSRASTAWPSTMSASGTIGNGSAAAARPSTWAASASGKCVEEALHHVLVLLGEEAARAVGDPGRERRAGATPSSLGVRRRRADAVEDAVMASRPACTGVHCPHDSTDRNRETPWATATMSSRRSITMKPAEPEPATGGGQALPGQRGVERRRPGGSGWRCRTAPPRPSSRDAAAQLARAPRAAACRARTRRRRPARARRSPCTRSCPATRRAERRGRPRGRRARWPGTLASVSTLFTRRDPGRPRRRPSPVRAARRAGTAGGRRCTSSSAVSSPRR